MRTKKANRSAGVNPLAQDPRQQLHVHALVNRQIRALCKHKKTKIRRDKCCQVMVVFFFNSRVEL